MPMYSVHSNRSAGERDYDVEALIWAVGPKAAAQVFIQDWMSLGWRPGAVVVSDIEPEPGHVPRVYEVVENLLLET